MRKSTNVRLEIKRINFFNYRQLFAPLEYSTLILVAIRIFVLVARLGMLFICIIYAHLTHAQGFSAIFPKNKQFVENSIEFHWNEKLGSGVTYLLQVNNLTNSPVDTFLKETSIRVHLPRGEYNWLVYAIENGIKLDSTSLNYFSIFTPKQIDSLNLWLNGDSIETTTNNKVTAWVDQSDSIYTLSQNISINQPVFAEGILNSYDGITFGSSQFISSNLTVNNSNFYIVAMYSHNGLINKQSRLIYGNANWFLGSFNGSYLMYDGVNILNSGPTTQNRFVVHSTYSKNDTVSAYLNGQFKVSKTGGRSPGLISVSRNAGDNFDGEVGEIIIYNGTVSQSDRANIETYLMDKYAPPVNLGADRRVCSFPDSIGLGIDYALDYSWSNGDTTKSIQIDSAGKYYVTITDMFERTSVDSMWFILDTSDYQIDFAFQDSTICFGDSIQLEAGRNRYSYQWSTMDSTNFITVKSPGRYKVTVKNCKGNFSSDSVEVFVNNPAFNLGADTVTCFNSLIQLQADSLFTNVDYLWSTGEVSFNIQADTSTWYSLKVTDNYNCSFMDSIQVSIDSSLFGLTLGPDTSLCQGNFIGLQNPNTSITSYQWTTGNTSAAQMIDTAGLYIVDVSSSRCSVSDSVQVLIQGFAPNSNFIASNFCFQDSVAFLNLSTATLGDTIISFEWDFNDGNSSAIANPIHKYSAVNQYSVGLRVTTDKNCSDTSSQIISIQPKPEANFTLQTPVACSKKPVIFEDSSTITTGSINNYLWNFGDTMTITDSSTIKNPSYRYDTLGSYNVRLIVVSHNMCRDTAEKTIDLFPSPIVRFDFEGSCLNDSTRFMDETILPQGAIKDYLWAVNGQISLFANPAIKFLDAGDKSVVLRIRTVAGCQNTLRDTIQIFENPIADFSLPVGCVEDDVDILDLSTSNDSIVKYRYVFNQSDTLFEQNPTFNTSSIGDYPLSLKVITTNLCSDSIQKQIQISENPKANFNILNNNSGIPFEIDLDNTSKGAVSYEWNFGDGGYSTDETPFYSYNDTGNYNLQLKVFNTNGCVDSITKVATALPYFLDALLERVFLEENMDGEVKVSVMVINAGNNTIKSIKLSADMNNQYQIRESFNEEVHSGGSLVYTFTGNFIKGSGQKLDFVCVKVESVNGIQDDVLINNQLCEKGFNQKLVLTAYPNPTSESLILEYVLPQDGELKINVYDQLGRKVLDEISTLSDEGFYQSRLNVTNLRAGIYYYSFSYNGEEINGSFMKR